MHISFVRHSTFDEINPALLQEGTNAENENNLKFACYRWINSGQNSRKTEFNAKGQNDANAPREKVSLKVIAATCTQASHSKVKKKILSKHDVCSRVPDTNRINYAILVPNFHRITRLGSCNTFPSSYFKDVSCPMAVELCSHLYCCKVILEFPYQSVELYNLSQLRLSISGDVSSAEFDMPRFETKGEN